MSRRAASAAFVAVAAAAALAVPATGAAWQRPVRLSSVNAGTGNGHELSLAVNRSGDGVVAWTDQIDAYHSVIQARLRTAGRAWRRVADLRLPGDPEGQDPWVAIDPAGSALAVWDGQTSHGQPNTDEPELEVARARAGRPFGRPYLLSTPDFVGDTYPFAGFDAAGRALVMWTGATHVWYAVAAAHGRLGRPREVENPNTSPAAVDVQRPVYALGADGSAVVAWSYYGAIYAAYRRSGGGFGGAQELNPATAGAQTDSFPQVAIDGHGHALVSWTANMRSYTSERIVVAASQRGRRGETRFSGPSAVVTGAFLGGLAMDAAGEATIVGQGDVLPGAGGVAVVRSAAGAVSRPESLGPIDAGPIYGVFSVAYDAAGDAFATWRHLDSQLLDDTYGVVYAEERRASGRFSGRPTAVSDSARDPFDPLVAAGSPGRATIVWPSLPRDLSSMYYVGSDA